MDEQALNELLECSVCLERLDHTSKVLPCQHTFCRRCLDEIVSTKKELRCPECRTLVSYRVEDLPANILLIRLLEGLKHANQIVSSSSSSTGAFKAKPPSRRHESLNINLSHTSGSKRQFEAKALYNYEAKEPGDLSFKKGEVITVCRQIDQNWYYGELSGQDGYFPSSYVQVVSNFSSSVPQVKALYDFDIKDENEKDCLKFQKDEILQLIRKVDDNWLEGRRGDKIGIFPLSFVELNDAAKSLVASRSRSSSSSSVGVCDGGSSGTSSGRSSAPAPGSRLPSSSFQQIWHHLPQQRERVALHPPMPNTAANAAASLPPPPPLNAPLAAMASTSAQQKRHSFTATSHTHSANSSPTIQQRRSLELSPTSGAMPPTSPLHVALPPPPAPACSGNVGSASAMKLLSHLESSGQISDDNKPGSADSNNPDISFGKTAIYSALYNYKPQKEDEVELRKGDYYTVTEKCQDGWYKGHCLKTGVNGVFPGNYVQISRQSSAFGSVNPNMPNVRAKEISVSSSIASAADMNNQPGSVFYGSPPPPCSGNMDTPPPAPPPATVSQPHIRTDGSSASHGTSSSSTNLHRQSASGTTARSRTLHHASSVSYTTSSILAAAYHSNNNNSSGGSGNTGVGSGSALSPSVSSSILAAAYSNNNNNCSGGNNSGVVGGSTLSPSVSSSSQLSSSSTITHTVVDTPGSKSHPGSGGNTSSSSLKNAASMGSCGGAGGHHAQNLNPSSSSSSSSSHRNVAEFAALQHSMSASTNITPPNVVAGISSTATSHSTSKEKKEKKDRDKPSLVKRLTMGKGKKSKSPSEGEDSVVTLSSDSSHTGHTRYRCIAPYPPQGEMELELKIGDIVLVYKKWEDGWFKGALQRTGKNGLFPGSFVTKCD